jgi:hypothetical protein
MNGRKNNTRKEPKELKAATTTRAKGVLKGPRMRAKGDNNNIKKQKEEVCL